MTGTKKNQIFRKKWYSPPVCCTCHALLLTPCTYLWIGLIVRHENIKPSKIFLYLVGIMHVLRPHIGLIPHYIK